MRKYKELNGLVEDLTKKVADAPKATPGVYKDKKEVIAELTKREIKHDPRKSKADLEKLLSSTTA